jgi:hypothetical protein
MGLLAASPCAVKLGIRRQGIEGGRCGVVFSGDVGSAGVELTTRVLGEGGGYSDGGDDDGSGGGRTIRAGNDDAFDDNEEGDAARAHSFRGSFTPCAITMCTLSGSFLTTLDQSILDVSTVSIAEDLGSDLTSTQWITTAYFLCCCALLPVAGRIGDRVSFTRLYMLGMLMFVCMSLACALSRSLPVLTFFRCLQGSGAAAIMATTMPLITHFTALEQRGVAIGYNLVLVGVALSIGPVVGGVITEYAGWPTLFFINLPIGLAGIVVCWVLLPDTPRMASDVDWVCQSSVNQPASQSVTGVVAAAVVGGPQNRRR